MIIGLHKLLYLLPFLFFIDTSIISQDLSYPIVDTNIKDYYSNSSVIDAPSTGEAFFGQDANYIGMLPSYTDNGDGSITDNITGLMWEKDMGTKITFDEAFLKVDTLSLAGFDDWRVPSIKELYSLILFTGRVMGAEVIDKFIDTVYFNQPLGDVSAGEREIDAQTWSSTQYLSTTMRGDSTVFGVNFLDGRIKGYPKYNPNSNNSVARKMYFRMVRGNTDYAKNQLVDNGDGTVSDLATGLMWQKDDDGITRDWEHSLQYAEDLTQSGYSDWRLPNAKELQSIVDYSRCPDITSSPAIDPVFECTEINDPDGNTGHYPYFWTGTSHLDGMNPYSGAVYIAFGEALGKMNGQLLDVHGAGAQRSDPKTGDPSDYPDYFGPQGDLRSVFNFVRCVRDDNVISSEKTNLIRTFGFYPNPTSGILRVNLDKVYPHISTKVLNLNGQKLLFIESFNAEMLEINLTDFANGSYFIQIDTGENKVIKSVLKN